MRSTLSLHVCDQGAQLSDDPAQRSHVLGGYVPRIFAYLKMAEVDCAILTGRQVAAILIAIRTTASQERVIHTRKIAALSDRRHAARPSRNDEGSFAP
jgi:hypothetical protein